MGRHALETVAAVVVAAGAFALLTGCSDQSSGSDATPLPRAATASPTAGPDSGESKAATSSAKTPIDVTAVVERAPLGLEVRYLDEDGRFATVAPEDFRR